MYLHKKNNTTQKRILSLWYNTKDLLKSKLHKTIFKENIEV